MFECVPCVSLSVSRNSEKGPIRRHEAVRRQQKSLVALHKSPIAPQPRPLSPQNLKRALHPCKKKPRNSAKEPYRPAIKPYMSGKMHEAEPSSHVAPMNGSCHTCGKCHIEHMKESCYTYAGILCVVCHRVGSACQALPTQALHSQPTPAKLLVWVDYVTVTMCHNVTLLHVWRRVTWLLHVFDVTFVGSDLLRGGTQHTRRLHACNMTPSRKCLSCPRRQCHVPAQAPPAGWRIWRSHIKCWKKSYRLFERVISYI